MMSSIVGLALTIVIVFGSIGIGGGTAQSFVFFPFLMIVTGIGLSLSLISSGLRDFLTALTSLRVLVSVPRDYASLRKSAKIQRCLISYLYAGAALGGLIGFIQMVHNLKDMNDVVPGLAVLALGFFYAAFLSECFIRPAVHKIEANIKSVV